MILGTVAVVLAIVLATFVDEYAEDAAASGALLAGGLDGIDDSIQSLSKTSDDHAIEVWPGEALQLLKADTVRLRDKIRAPGSVTVERAAVQLEALRQEAERIRGVVRDLSVEGRPRKASPDANGGSATHSAGDTGTVGLVPAESTTSDASPADSLATVGGRSASGGSELGASKPADSVARDAGRGERSLELSAEDLTHLRARRATLRSIVQEFQGLVDVNEDARLDGLDSYAVPWFRRTLAKTWMAWAVGFVVAVMVAGCLLVPLRLAWQEDDAKKETVDRLRARARKVEFLSIVVFGLAVAALIVGAVAFVQVGTLVVQDVASAAKVENKQRVARQAEAEPVRDPDRGPRLQLTLARYRELLSEERKTRSELRARRARLPEDLSTRDAKLMATFEARAAQDTDFARDLAAWRKLDERLRSAEQRWSNSPSGSQKETNADRDRQATLRKLERLLTPENPVAQAYATIKEERDKLGSAISTSERRVDALSRQAAQIEEDKIDYDVAKLIGSELPDKAERPGDGADTGAKSIAVSPVGPLPESNRDDGANSQTATKPEESDGSGAAPEPVKAPAPLEEKSPFESFDVQLLLTRAGVSIFTLFLVQMLLSLQRYTTRLASFYNGRADALELLSVVGQGSPLDRMSAADRKELLARLSPMAVDYAKASSPNKDVVELAKAMAAGKGGGKG